MKLSIVATLYGSQSYIQEFYSRVTAVASKLFDSDYEIILVNDGSPDESLNVAIQLSSFDSKVKVIDLSRNFGHQNAIFTGLSHASGEFVFLIDIDLEEQPEWLEDFYFELLKNKDDIDVVYGIQETRKGGFFERNAGRIYYSIFNYLSQTKIPASIMTCHLMKRSFVDALLMHGESDFFISVMGELSGFKRVGIRLKKLSISPTTFSFTKKLKLAVNSIASFSNFPLILMFYAGFTISVLSFFYLLFIILSWFFYDMPLHGWTSLIVSVWLFGGLILAGLGIIGLYLGKVFMEVKRRPRSIVRSIYKNGKNQM